MPERASLIDSKAAKWVLAIVAVFGFGWAIFQTFHVKNPKLQFEIVSQTKLLNKADDFSSVKLLVDTIDVLGGGQNISSYVVKVQNIGNQHLRWNDYDEGKFGLVVNNGILLQEVELVDASSSHIGERVKESLCSNSDCFIEIPSISLDRDEWYTISFSVIHREDLLPSFSPVGKIIGQQHIIITTPSTKSNKFSVMDALFSGGIWAILLRYVAYLLMWVVIILIIGYVISGVSELIAKRKRERILKTIVQDSSLPSFVRDDYLKNMDRNMRMAEHYYSHSDKLLGNFYKKLEDYLSDFGNIDSKDFDRYKSIYCEINQLVNLGYLLKSGERDFTFPRDVKEAVDKVLLLLKKNKIVHHYYDSDIIINRQDTGALIEETWDASGDSSL